MTEFNQNEKKSAYKKARKASQFLDSAAQELGFENVDELSLEALDLELDDDEDMGVKAITNAHSYLNNGGLECLLEEE